MSADASQRDIARAYRRAVQRAHPDVRPDDSAAATRFQALADAYELLGNPDRRADYDHARPTRQPSRKPPGPARASARQRRPSSAFLPSLPSSQLIWAGPVHVEPPATAASSHRRSAPAAEFEDPPVILGVHPGQVWGRPW